MVNHVCILIIIIYLLWDRSRGTQDWRINGTREKNKNRNRSANEIYYVVDVVRCQLLHCNSSKPSISSSASTRRSVEANLEASCESCINAWIKLADVLLKTSDEETLYRCMQNEAFRPKMENPLAYKIPYSATNRVRSVCWNKHVCETLRNRWQISSNKGKQLPNIGNKSRSVRGEIFHVLRRLFRQAVRRSSIPWLSRSRNSNHRNWYKRCK
jgi:hypothetical protein